jgi:phosphatidylglycerophosphate synthase
MLDKSLRVVKEVVCEPAALVAAKYVTPSQVTILGFVFGLLCPVCIVMDYFVLGFILWLLNRLMDGVDGTIARISNSQTDFGGYLDIICDFIVYSIIPIALVVSRPNETLYILLAFLEASFFVNAASLMFLSAIQEKRSAGAASSGA